MLKLITQNIQMLLVGLLAGAIAFGVTQCDRKQELKAEVQQQRNNIKALNDTVSTYKNKAGELTQDIAAYQTDVDQLKDLNADLAQELDKEKGKVDQISKLYAEISADSTEIDSITKSRIGLSSWRFNWSLSRRGQGWERILEGYAEFKLDSLGVPYDERVAITKNLLTTQIITGIRNVNGTKRIFVRSTYPNVTFTNIQGAILEDAPLPNKSSRFGLGLHLGGGITPNGVTPVISAGINFNLIRF